MLKRFIITTALSVVMCAGAPSFAATPDIIVAKIDGKPVYKEDLKKIEAAIAPDVVEQAKKKDPEGFYSNLRDQTISIKLLTEASAQNFDMKALKEGVQKANLKNNADLEKIFLQTAEQIILQAYINENVGKLVTDKAIKEEYDQFVKDFPKDEMEVHVRHIVLKTENEANQVIKELKNGGDFQKIAREKSLDKVTAPEGGDLGFIHKGRLDPNFTDAVFALKIGGFSDTPVKTAIGWHVLKADDRRKIKAPKFEDIKDQLSSAVFQKLLKKTIENLQDKASIERFDMNGKPLDKTTDTSASKDKNQKEVTSKDEKNQKDAVAK